MRELADRSTQLVTHDNPKAQELAVLGVVYGVKTGQLTPPEARTVLEALGLLDVAADMLARGRAESVQESGSVPDPDSLPANAASPLTRAHSPSKRHPGVDGGAA